jgi:twitching motility protein PilT
MIRSLVEAGGEALVMHAGEKPYVVSPAGQVELANRALTMEAMKAFVAQLLPADVSRALDEFGAVQHEIVSPQEFPGERFTVVAARGIDDLWVEIRRRKVDEAAALPEVPVEPAAQRLAIAATVRRGVEAARLRRPAGTPQPSRSAPAPKVAAEPTPESPTTILSAMAAAPPPLPPLVPMATPLATPPTPLRTPQHDPADPAAFPPPTIVLPMPTGAARSEGAAGTAAGGSGIDRLLRIAATRGASALYLSSNAPPSVRVDGDIRVLEGEASLAPQDLESLLLAAVPDSEFERLRSGLVAEWTGDVERVGRVRCTTFRDHRGPGAVFRMMPAHAVRSERIGLPRELESLALEPGGLVLVAGPRQSGKRTVIAALVDVMNRRRQDLVVAIESEIGVEHGPGTSIVSQREVREDDFESAARAALREDPDVLVIESMHSVAIIDIALQAATSGRLVIGGLTVRDGAAAVERIVNAYPGESRQQVQRSLAENLRGVIAQVLLPKKGGGRVVAREILLNTPAVARLIAEGHTSQLAGDAGPAMQRLNDVIAGLVQSGAVDVSEAYRRTADRTGLLARLKRLGIDTSAIE